MVAAVAAAVSTIAEFPQRLRSAALIVLTATFQYLLCNPDSTSDTICTASAIDVSFVVVCSSASAIVSDTPSPNPMSVCQAIRQRLKQQSLTTTTTITITKSSDNFV